MLTFDKFLGINNVLPSHRLKSEELRRAMNVDIGLSGELKRRSGYTQTDAACHESLWQADGFLLAIDDGDLVAITPAGVRTTVYLSLGATRVWYVNLPDGRTAFSNGLICGITDGTTTTDWGVLTPASLGAFTDVAGSLDPGDYKYQITYVRTVDGREGAPLVAEPVTIASGGVLLTGLPELTGHSINVYISGANGDEAFYAGNTTNAAFTFNGANTSLVLPCRTDDTDPAPAGKLLAFFRGRALTAVGPVLYASRTNMWETFDFRRDFKQFAKNITLVVPVDDGLYVGTENELAFLGGTEFDKLAYTRVIEGDTVLGSGVAVRGELIKQREGVGEGSAMVCIADGVIVAGFNGGQVVRMTEGRYRTNASEVSATFRMVDNIPQYIAIPQ